MEVKDISIDENNDLFFKDGDLFIDFSDANHIQDIIYSYQGYWKEFPNCGVGLFDYLNSSGRKQELWNNVNTQIKADGYTINMLDISDLGEVKIDCSRY